MGVETPTMRTKPRGYTDSEILGIAIGLSSTGELQYWEIRTRPDLWGYAFSVEFPKYGRFPNGGYSLE